MKSQTYFIHIDGDNFFVSCELTRFPEYRGKPVIVGQERGIAVALNAEAKALGIERGAPIFQIKRDFPGVVILPSHFDLYQQLSKRMCDILSGYVDEVEHYSIDECFAKVTLSDESKCDSLLATIRADIESQIGITVSAGIAVTKVLAKVGSKANKPNGQLYISVRNHESLLRGTPIGKIWGIGRATHALLSSLGVKNAWQFTQLSAATYHKKWNAPLVELWYELNGESRMKLIHRDYKQSMQSTRMFSSGMGSNLDYIWSELSYHTEVLCRRLLRDNLVTKQIIWFVSSKKGIGVSSQITLSGPVQNPVEILRQLEKQFYALVSKTTEYRSAGVSVMCSPTDSIIQNLFNTHNDYISAKPLLVTLENLRSRFGDHSICIGSSSRAVSSRHVSGVSRNIESKYISGLPLPYIGEVV